VTRDEAWALLFELVAALGGGDVSEPTMAVWTSRIERYSFEVGRAALDEVAHTWRSPRFPPIGVFDQAVDVCLEAARERGRYASPVDAAQLEAPVPLSHAEQKARLAGLRAVLADHAPPQPKPTPAPVEPVPLARALAATLEDLEPTDDEPEAQC
jgi:hypothetical protein